MSDDFTLALAEDTGVATIELSRPERLNMLEPRFFPALRDAVTGLADGGRTRALVIRSTGRHFSAGMALDVFRTDGAGTGMMAMLDTGSARKRLAFQQSLRRLMGCLDALDEAPFPVVCAVQGGCIGGALDLAVACDIRLASADAFFTVQEIHIGMVADLGVLQRLPKIVPQGVAREMAYTGERVGADRALAVGLVNAVLPDTAALHQQADKLARDIASRSPLAIAGTKQALNFARDHGSAESLAHMALLQSALFDIDEMAAAIDAWKDKRSADFDALVVPQKI